MVNNTVDTGKFEGAGTSKTIIVATSPETRKNQKELSWGGKFADRTLKFGREGKDFVTYKLEPNTEKDIAKRKNAKRDSEEITH